MSNEPSQRSGLSTLEIPDKDANGLPTDNPGKAVTWKTLANPTEIEEKLLDRNIAHFGQANGTLFASPEFQKAFGYSG
jgi:hypothetical protein